MTVSFSFSPSPNDKMAWFELRKMEFNTELCSPYILSCKSSSRILMGSFPVPPIGTENCITSNARNVRIYWV